VDFQGHGDAIEGNDVLRGAEEYTRVEEPRHEISATIMSARRANIYRANDWFEVLQTTPRSQTAVMKLKPGQASGDEPEAHKASDQVLLLVEGELSAEIAGARLRMKAGDVVIISPGIKHKFMNRGNEPAVTFSVYSPPEYPPHEKG
jgi:mannose-6-phosphate isomerase-like protein (cupin superfamily)